MNSGNARVKTMNWKFIIFLMKKLLPLFYSQQTMFRSTKVTKKLLTITPEL